MRGLRPHLARSLAALVLLGVGQQASGSCIRSELNRVATVEIEACTELPAFAAERLQGTQLAWLVAWVEAVLTNHRGVVLTGTVTKKIHVEQYSDTDFEIVDVELADEPGRWFLPVESRTSCNRYPPDSEIELYVVDTCCDVTPPYDVPCGLDVGSANPVPPPLAKLLEAG